MVIVKDEALPRNQWKLGRVADVCVSDVGVAMADLTLDDKGRRQKRISYLERPVHKLVLLLATEECGLGIPQQRSQ